MSDAQEFDAADPEAIQRRNRVLGIEKSSRANAMLAMMDHPETRAWVWKLLSDCHLFNCSFSRDALAMAFQEGERNVGLQIFLALQAECPELYQLMAKEAHERDKRRPTG